MNSQSSDWLTVPDSSPAVASHGDYCGSFIEYWLVSESHHLHFPGSSFLIADWMNPIGTSPSLLYKQSNAVFIQHRKKQVPLETMIKGQTTLVVSFSFSSPSKIMKSLHHHPWQIHQNYINCSTSWQMRKQEKNKNKNQGLSNNHSPP